MERFSDRLYQITNGKVALAATVVFLLFTVLVLPSQSENTGEQSRDVGSPDTLLFYSVEKLYELAEAYTEEGRDAYVRARFTFDLIWPLVYAFFLTATTGWVFKKAIPAAGWWQRANIVPVLGMLFDYLENIATSLVMVRYPARTAVIDSLAPLFTSIKWIFVAGSFALLFIGTVVLLWKWINGAKSRPD